MKKVLHIISSLIGVFFLINSIMVLRFVLITYYGKDYLTVADENIYGGLKWICGVSFLLAIPTLFFPIRFFLKSRK